jgi:hypothetical protein|tara:strand:- start:446 stop:577 length:132 start_codon:yes stop_codon:yes gene_type:complete
MSDHLKEYFESQEANEDSRSDTKVALIIVLVAVMGAVFWVSGQ